jgi:hypothetical protein
VGAVIQMGALDGVGHSINSGQNTSTYKQGGPKKHDPFETYGEIK